MVLVHKFIASMLLVAMLAAGPLCTCALALEADGPMAMASMDGADHSACDESAVDIDAHGDCPDQCHDMALEEAVLAPVEAMLGSPDRVVLAIVSVDVEQPTHTPSIERKRGPPPRRYLKADTPVSLHTLLLN